MILVLYLNSGIMHKSHNSVAVEFGKEYCTVRKEKVNVSYLEFLLPMTNVPGANTYSRRVR